MKYRWFDRLYDRWVEGPSPAQLATASAASFRREGETDEEWEARFAAFYRAYTDVTKRTETS